MKKLIAIIMMVASIAVAQEPDYSMMIFNHRVAPGMTFAQVVSSWGNPRTFSTNMTSQGTFESWWYIKNGNVAEVTFFNGQVVSVSNFQ